MPKSKTEKTAKVTKTRKLKRPGYQPFWRRKRVKMPVAKLPNSFKIFIKSLKIIKDRWKTFSIIAAVYLLLSMILVKGITGTTDIPLLKEALSNAVEGKGNQLTVGFSVFGLLVGTTGNPSSQAGSVYQLVLFVGLSLVIIWALRQAYAGAKFTVKDAFYKGFTPLVPFLGIMLIIGVQMIPLLLANMLYNVVLVGGLAKTTLEQVLWAIGLLGLLLWSLYMVTRSIVALYIVTLPEAPFKAMRSARELVRYRRLTVMRKMLFLPIALLTIGVVIMLPIIIVLTPIAEVVFSAMTAFSLVLVHSYLYALYRELL